MEYGLSAHFVWPLEDRARSGVEGCAHGKITPDISSQIHTNGPGTKVRSTVTHSRCHPACLLSQEAPTLHWSTMDKRLRQRRARRLHMALKTDRSADRIFSQSPQRTAHTTALNKFIIHCLWHCEAHWRVNSGKPRSLSLLPGTLSLAPFRKHANQCNGSKKAGGGIEAKNLPQNMAGQEDRYRLFGKL